MHTSKLSTLGLLILLANSLVFSQNSELNKVSMILDIAGSSGFYSINGEYNLISKDNYSINTHLGFGYLPIQNTSFLSVPVGFSVILGSSKHHIEGGLGFSYIQGMRYIPVTIQNETTYFPLTAIYFSPSIGYRYDKMTKGLIFRIYYSPMIVAKDLFNRNKFIEDAIPDNFNTGGFTKKEYFDLMYGGDNYPVADNELMYFGLSLGYRF
jgi:hypothetical protein